MIDYTTAGMEDICQQRGCHFIRERYCITYTIYTPKDADSLKDVPFGGFDEKDIVFKYLNQCFLVMHYYLVLVFIRQKR